MSFNPYFKNITEEEITQRLNSVKDVEIESMSIDDIQNTIGDLILGYNRTTYKFNLKGLSRSRKNDNDPFLNTADLWIPDFNKIEEKKWKYGRCNDKGEGVFYASSETDTAICEAHPLKNSYITVVNCIPIHGQLNAVVQVVGVTALSKARNDLRPILENHYYRMKEENEEFFYKNLLIDNFVTEQFTQIVEEGENWKYKACIAITRILLSAPNVVGIVYPSIAANSKGVNFVFKPEFANNNLQIVGAGVFEVLDTDESLITLRHIMSPQSICTKGLGEIRWKSHEQNELTEFTINK